MVLKTGEWFENIKLKTEMVKLKLKMKKLNFEELGHQLGKIGQTHVLEFYPPNESTQGAVMAPFINTLTFLYHFLRLIKTI